MRSVQFQTRIMSSLGAFCAVMVGCVPIETPPDPMGGGDDPGYIGSAACLSCHPGLSESHERHGHAQALTAIVGSAPVFPQTELGDGTPNPPPNLQWADIAWVIGGYSTAANFVDNDGFILTDAATSKPVASSVGRIHAANSTGFGLASVDFGGTPLAYDCFRCHITGGESFADNGGRRQENRPGVGGTWAEAGVQCEACHGPGSAHVASPQAVGLEVDGSATACAECHTREVGADAIEVIDGFIASYQQASELRASPHANFGCTVCHDPHVSAIQERDRGIRNGCDVCHTETNMARHMGKIFVQGDYVERMNCESCHMPLASRNSLSADDSVTGGFGGKIGDVRTHVFSIDVVSRQFETLLTDAGDQVELDADGRVSGITLDFVCLRCHNDQGNAFMLTDESAAGVAPGIHDF
ncbi:MAG: hypothetical protein DHS20C16_26740 [Phycisphaerae bacterium]|nr:MAG: hypothetical protein DHS20C16_26740 [Phycisphaerae bacterium]